MLYNQHCKVKIVKHFYFKTKFYEVAQALSPFL